MSWLQRPRRADERVSEGAGWGIGHGVVLQSVVRRWLGPVALYAVALVVVWFTRVRPPSCFQHDRFACPHGVGGGGRARPPGLWALIIAFFLLYSPFYLIGKLPRLIGKGGWVDQREVRFYLACFGFLCLLAALTYVEPLAGLTVFAIAAGCGPVFWRVLV
jgi:hypothetical protein